MYGLRPNGITNTPNRLGKILFKSKKICLSVMSISQFFFFNLHTLKF